MPKTRKTIKGGIKTPLSPIREEELDETLQFKSNLTSDECEKRIKILTFLYHSERKRNDQLLHTLERERKKMRTLTLKKSRSRK